LLAAAGDEGAKKLLERHAADLVKIPVGDPGVIRDVDTPADLAPPLGV
jgi:molybdenum cofactor cytidylyltransferase